MLSLAYRIASMKHVLPHPSTMGGPYDADALRDRLACQAQHIAASPQLRLDNVAEFYASHDQQVWDVGEDIPNWAPPFPAFFVEWNEPQVWNIPHQPQPAYRLGQHGIFVLAFQITDGTRRDVEPWRDLANSFVGGQLDWNGTLLEAWQQALLNSRWVLCCERWSAPFERPVCGSPIWIGIQSFLFISAQGQCLQTTHGGAGLRFTVERFGQSPIASPLHILGLGLSFCHCKNVTRTEFVDDQGERWHRRSGVPRIKFYTLDINPMRETLRREGKSEETGIKKALHICRGHFAHYTPESPLFGKYVGTFWRPDHVRGSKENGEVHKRYEVKLPAGGD